MALYSYVCRSPDGKSVRGTITALDQPAAELALRDMELLIEQLSEALPIRSSTNNLDPIHQAEAEPLPARTDTAVTVEPSPLVSGMSAVQRTAYAPLTETIRLYCGWLLAWYVAIFAIGSYQSLRSLPFDVPFVNELYASTIIMGFACGAFLFLLLSSMHRAIGRGILPGIVLTVAGIGLLLLFQANV